MTATATASRYGASRSNARGDRGASVYEIITERIIKLLEAGVAPWRRTWTAGNAPQNLISRRPYRGINRLLLECADKPSPYWLTYNQVQELKGTIRKGAKTEIVTYCRFPRKSEHETDERKRVPLLRYYRIFNASEIDGIEQHIPTPPPPFVPHERAAAIVAGMPNAPAIIHREQRACYYPSWDMVNMPQPETFETPAAYYETLFHELIHATGHPTRLDRATLREGKKIYDRVNEAYSREELVAEIGAQLVCAEAGIENETIENSAAYLRCWIDVLTGDPRLIVQAASAAQKAADYVLGRFDPADDGEVDEGAEQDGAAH